MTNKSSLMRWLDRRSVITGGLATALVHKKQSANATQSDPLRIGIALGLSGTYVEESTMQRSGYELWQDEVNARGGILQRPVELVIRDDKSDASHSRAIYKNFVTSGSIDHVFGPYSSEITMEVAATVDEADYPMLAAGASDDAIWQQGRRGIFGMWTPASRYTHGMLRLARDNGLTRIALFNASDTFSKRVAAGTLQWAPYLKMSVVHAQAVGNGPLEFAPALHAAMKQNADLVMIAGHLSEASAARQSLRDIDWSPRAFYATVGPALPDWLGHIGIETDTTFTTSIWEEIVPYPRSHEFDVAFRKRFGISPSYHAATSYAAGEILEKAILAVGSLDRRAVRDALFALDTYSIIGRFAVDRTGMQVKRLDMLVQWQDGVKQIVWPEDAHTKQPVFQQ